MKEITLIFSDRNGDYLKNLLEKGGVING